MTTATASQPQYTIGVKVGELDVINSGSVLIHDTSSIEFTIEGLNIELKFWIERSYIHTNSS